MPSAALAQSATAVSLRHSDAGHDPGGADAARADTDLDHIRARFDQGTGGGGGSHIARDDRQVGVGRADHTQYLSHAAVMAVSRIDGNNVHLGGHQRFDPLHHVLGHTHGRAAQQTAVVILGGVGVLGALFNVLDGDQATQLALFVHDGQLFNAVGRQQFLGLLQRGAHGSGDQVLAGHDLADGAGIVRLEPQVAVGQDAHQLLSTGDGHAADAVAGHQRLRVPDQMFGREIKRIGDHAVLAALDLVNLRGLLLDRHVFMNDAQTAFPGHGDGQTGVRHRIHGGGQKRHVQLDGGSQHRGGVHVARQHVAFTRNEQHVVEREPGAEILFQHKTTLSSFNCSYFTSGRRECQRAAAFSSQETVSSSAAASGSGAATSKFTVISSLS